MSYLVKGNLKPLLVELDGALIKMNSFYEEIYFFLRKTPMNIFWILFWALKGKNYLREKVRDCVEVNVCELALDQDVVEALYQAQSDERLVYLISDVSKQKVLQLFGQLGLSTNFTLIEKKLFLKSDLESLRKKYGELEYLKKKSSFTPNKILLVLKQIRLHHWIKNFLLFLPALIFWPENSQADWPALVYAFFSFSLMASTVYVFNDIVDLNNDRKTPIREDKLFAVGALSLGIALPLILVSLILSVTLSFQVNASFQLCLLLYLTLNILYSYYLRKLFIVDALVLSLLYALRVLSGAIAAGVVIQFWLLNFTITFFLGLALFKRCAELAILLEVGVRQSAGRGYSVNDYQLVQRLAIASSLISYLFLLPHLLFDVNYRQYSNPYTLLLIIPLLAIYTYRILYKIKYKRVRCDLLTSSITDPLSFFFATFLFAIFWIAQ